MFILNLLQAKDTTQAGTKAAALGFSVPGGLVLTRALSNLSLRRFLNDPDLHMLTCSPAKICSSAGRKALLPDGALLEIDGQSGVVILLSDEN